jgi:hypothetical protein
MADKKIVEEHDEVIRLTIVEHYEAHPKRSESAEFRKVKKELHEENVPCWINNGKCEGNLEVHHFMVEWSAETEIDPEKVRQENPEYTDADCKANMMVLCEKHHRHKGFGIHTTPFPIWRLQKYMTAEALEDFERAVKNELYKNK